MLHSCGDQDSLSTFTEPRSLPEDITNVRVRFLLKFYGAVISTSLDKLRYILYTRSVSRLSLSSGFKLESSPPTAAAAKFHSYRAYIAEQQFLAVTKPLRFYVGPCLLGQPVCLTREYILHICFVGFLELDFRLLIQVF